MEFDPSRRPATPAWQRATLEHAAHMRAPAAYPPTSRHAPQTLYSPAALSKRREAQHTPEKPEPPCREAPPCPPEKPEPPCPPEPCAPPKHRPLLAGLDTDDIILLGVLWLLIRSHADTTLILLVGYIFLSGFMTL